MVASGLRLAACLVMAAAAAVLAAPPVPRAAMSLLLPSDDPFYRVPDDLNGTKPGTIISWRLPPKPIAAFGKLAVQLKSTHQILYRTTDSLDHATATVLTVLVPQGADLDKVLSYQVAEDAATINCAPSYVFQQDHATGPDHGTEVTELEFFLVMAALAQKWVVIVPDYLGPKGAFLANRLAGQATLDGIRAAVNSEHITGIKKGAKVAMWGYSGGSLATLWAAELQPTYAPELKNIVGAAAGGTVPNISSVIESVNKKSYAGLIAAGIVGLANQYQPLEDLLQKHVLPKFKDQFFAPRKQCQNANGKQFANKDIPAMLDDPQLVFQHPLAKKLTKENALGHATPRVPLFIYKAMKDEVSPEAETDALVRRYCDAGTLVEYRRYGGANHAELAAMATPRALSWLQDSLHGRLQSTKCPPRITLPSWLFDLDSFRIMPKTFLNVLWDILGVRDIKEFIQSPLAQSFVSSFTEIVGSS
ncbi:hypothetical protein CP532_0100 [Ophiocordyceps camponoti-leonardi (nom. inval.)]|nr:hypothetical protein CP532_0100 [Ophiocordyceps camponoti-leonardi (nom. inval.)]